MGYLPMTEEEQAAAEKYQDDFDRATGQGKYWKQPEPYIPPSRDDD